MMFLIVISLIVALVGLSMMSNATAGVGLIAFACYLAILARIEQASKVKKES